MKLAVQALTCARTRTPASLQDGDTAVRKELSAHVCAVVRHIIDSLFSVDIKKCQPNFCKLRDPKGRIEEDLPLRNLGAETCD